LRSAGVADLDGQELVEDLVAGVADDVLAGLWTAGSTPEAISNGVSIS
jgi:hypothetical protein